ncbi:hypothetical protein A0H81_09187 [Grifola frondosa]|uniref:Uncharacterized protein n=1 Tax=Grifola frondosa TaxID=5627 RepID=A0A1C7M144_GRIFR|nr:hypothetical protein A0H81_09187 [Grifola frondosa]
MPWPPTIPRTFKATPPGSSELEFHGPYNKLLYSLFPTNSDFSIVPRYLESATLPSGDLVFSFTVFFPVANVDRPVLSLELTGARGVESALRRREADEHVRRRMHELRDQCPLPKLRAISAMGTKLSFYHVDAIDDDAKIIPLPAPARVDDSVPAQQWDCDVLDGVGEARLRKHLAGSSSTRSKSDNAAHKIAEIIGQLRSPNNSHPPHYFQYYNPGYSKSYSYQSLPRRGRSTDNPKGLLLTSHPSCGKSFPVDLWFSALPTSFKARKHYCELVLEYRFISLIDTLYEARCRILGLTAGIRGHVLPRRPCERGPGRHDGAIRRRNTVLTPTVQTSRPTTRRT